MPTKAIHLLPRFCSPQEKARTLPLYHTVLFTRVVSGSKDAEHVYLMEEVYSVSWERKDQREGFCIYMTNLSQSHPDLRRAAVQSPFLKLLELLITSMGLQDY